MIELTQVQHDILSTLGHQLVTGGPGSGKTTVSIIKAAKIARESLKPEQSILFLSFARATVSRVLDAMNEENQILPIDKKRIEVDTYHAMFWRILKTHGYLVGLPRRLTILTPPNEAILLSSLRMQYKADSKLTSSEKAEKKSRERDELVRLAKKEGLVCFDLFADLVATLLNGSSKVCELISTRYPFIILDEFQDTNADQWRVVQSLGKGSTLIALADPEQRIFDFIGADPARLEHFRSAFYPAEHDLARNNHRSKGTEIALFGNDLLTGIFRQRIYRGIALERFNSNQNQAFASLGYQVLKARERLTSKGKQDWSLAILVPTKKMTREVSDSFRNPTGKIPVIDHTAVFEMEGPILAAELIAFLLQKCTHAYHFDQFVELLCSYYRGKGGAAPTNHDLKEAEAMTTALCKRNQCLAEGRSLPRTSVLNSIAAVFDAASKVELYGDPARDWISMLTVLANGECKRLKTVANDVRDVRLLGRGAQLRQRLIQDWQVSGGYNNALAITRQSFVQDHFATANKPETGVVVMNMHKAKGKQFDEVIIFEGWPRSKDGKVLANFNRIVRDNMISGLMTQARQNLRVSITRAKQRTTILTPLDDPCVLIKGWIEAGRDRYV